MNRANWAAGNDAKRKLQEIAARDLGGAVDGYDVAELVDVTTNDNDILSTKEWTIARGAVGKPFLVKFFCTRDC